MYYFLSFPLDLRSFSRYGGRREKKSFLSFSYCATTIFLPCRLQFFFRMQTMKYSWVCGLSKFCDWGLKPSVCQITDTDLGQVG